MKSRFVRLALLSLVMLTSLPTLGAESTYEPSLSPQQVNFLRQSLKQTLESERSWSTNWTLGFVALTGAQEIGANLVNDQAYRTDFHVGAVSTAIGLIPTCIFIPRMIYQKDLKDNKIEAALEEAAENQSFMQSWISHAGGVLYSLGVGAVLGLGYHHWFSALSSVAVGIPIGELMIRTRSTSAVQALQKYRAGELTKDEKKESLTFTLHLTGTAAVLGLKYDL